MKNLKESRNFIIGLILIFLIFDQITKYYASKYILLDEVLIYFYGFGLTLKINEGFIFGIGEQYSFTIFLSIFFRLFSTLVIINIWRFYKIFYRESVYLNMFFVLFIAGVLGNITDQLMYGYVVDFILWPGPGIANIADLYFDFGFIALIIELYKNPQIDNKSFFRIKNRDGERNITKEFLQFIKNDVKTKLETLK